MFDIFTLKIKYTVEQQLMVVFIDNQYANQGQKLFSYLVTEIRESGRSNHVEGWNQTGVFFLFVSFGLIDCSFHHYTTNCE